MKEDFLGAGSKGDYERLVKTCGFGVPNPGVVERGIKGRYRYESHGLRFDVSRPTEERTQFRQRINKRARDEEDGIYQGGGADPNWLLGTHSDVAQSSSAKPT
ncbi:hypothetical protein [Pseudomonas sp. C1C7]|uniref:hypothetical protein n=1 Tax=Pseudomonas sp. C1C7 TaxID=2735272 RepID=UPI002114808A|nr:hypothetical protein [Pseudomonas sp. C1C7]